MIDSRAAAETLVRLLVRAEDREERRTLRRDLRRLRSRPAAEFLLKHCLAHRNATVRETAARALGGIGWLEAVPALVEASDDRKLDVRVAAIEALGRLPDQRAVDRLLERAEVRDEHAALTALWSLEESRSSDPRIGEVALRLAESRGKPATVRAQAATLLGLRPSDAATAALIALLKHRDWRLRVAAIDALTAARDPAAVTPLIDRLDREQGRLHAEVIAALEGITGVEYGADAKLWRSRWAEAERSFEPPERQPAAAGRCWPLSSRPAVRPTSG